MMGDFDTNALRSAGLEWHAHAQGSDEECGAGIALVEYADAAADEIDRLRAERDELLAKVAELEARPLVVTGGIGFEVGPGARVQVSRQVVTGGVGFKL